MIKKRVVGTVDISKSMECLECGAIKDIIGKR